MTLTISLDSIPSEEALNVLRKHTNDYFRFVARGLANNAANRAWKEQN